MKYLIRKGDSLSVIAKHHFLTVASIMAVNPQITNPNLIKAGDIIILPCEVEPPPPPPVSGSFVVDRLVRDTIDAKTRLIIS